MRTTTAVGDEKGGAVVTSSDGKREHCEGYEAALDLARRFRTA